MAKIKKLLGGSPFPESWTLNAGLLVMRIFSGLFMAFGHGLRKVPPSEGFINGAGEMGFPVPAFFAWMAGLSEFAGGILIAIGLFTRPSAFLMGATMFVAGFIRHGADPFGRKELALIYLVIAVMMVLTGPGKYSVDKVLFGKNGLST